MFHRGLIINPDTNEPQEFVMRNLDGGLVRGTMNVYAGGTVLFIPGSGDWRADHLPSSDDIEQARDERVGRRTTTRKKAKPATDSTDAIEAAAAAGSTAS